MRTEPVARGAATGKPFLIVEDLAKVYAPNAPAVFEGVGFAIAEGEFVCVLGHSGCGKSTILKILAGLEEPTSGHVIMDGRQISGPSLDRGVVFQSHALFPWLTVRQNIAFAVRSRFPDMRGTELKVHCDRYVAMVGLKAAADRKPFELSGGMKQRVGIARAFSIQPKMLLMDEPFGALDALTRGVVQDELLRICSQIRQTVFMITHDVDEAILLSDRILLMSNGPHASIAEIVVNTMPRGRERETMHHDPQFYRMRNHLVDFLVHRSKNIRARSMDAGGPARFAGPLIVSPGLERDPASTGHSSAQGVAVA